MAISREKKESIVRELNERLRQVRTLLFTNYQGLPVKDLGKFRKILKGEGIDFLVVKKTLLARVFKESRIPINARELDGQLAIVLGYQDEVKTPKLIYEFSKENNNLKILGGFFDGKNITKEEVIAFAKLPSREELLWKFIFVVSSPLTNLANVLQGNIRNLVAVLSNIKTIDNRQQTTERSN